VRPQLWVFAGPNGAGKSTLVADRLKGRLPTVNPDELALSLPDGRNRELEAGKLAVTARHAHLAARRSFGFETTLTGRGELMLIRQARQIGYKTNLVFVGISSVELSVGRVSLRVSRGGHDVPHQALLRRFERSFGNLKKALTLVDRAFLVDNTARRRRLVAIRDGPTVHRRSRLPPWAETALAGLLE
jgi:predicted ABC-type ATPase